MLPTQVIWTVVYNTSNYGPTPIGAAPCSATSGGCGYDSLNVGLTPTNTVGTDTDPDGAFLNSTTASNYCDNGAGGTGTLRLDTGVPPNCTAGNDWTGYTPAGELRLAAPPVVTQTGLWRPATPAGAVPVNNGARVNWKGASVPAGGSAITGYVVTPYLGSVAQPAHAFNSTATTQTITGLTNGTAYTFKVASTNAAGTGPQSRASAKATAGAPGKPGVPTVTKVRSGVLKVAYKAPMNNGAVIRTFTATCTSSNGGVTRARSHKGTAPIGVKNLTVGKSYTCTVFATNRRGNGPRSNASSAVTA